MKAFSIVLATLAMTAGVAESALAQGKPGMPAATQPSASASASTVDLKVCNRSGRGATVAVSYVEVGTTRFINRGWYAVGVGLYTDARLYAEAGIPVALYGAGPRTLLESNAKRADENLVLEDLRRATQVVACTLAEMLEPAAP